jgi:protein deglycase
VPKDKFCKLLSGMKVEADEIFNEELLENDYDAIVMPGGISGVTTFTDNPLFMEFIRTQLKDSNKIIGANSTSACVILKNHNMLEGYDEITCHPRLHFTFDHEEYVDETICRDDMAVV